MLKFGQKAFSPVDTAETTSRFEEACFKESGGQICLPGDATCLADGRVFQLAGTRVLGLPK